MLTIGRLAPGAADYYLGEVATSAEDYYTGRGESTGRWVGSLAPELGLEGEVSPEAFRAVLEGRDPRTGHQLARRPGRVHEPRRNVRQGQLFGNDLLDVPRVAARLGLSARQVRRLLELGAVADCNGGPVSGPVLVGERVPRPSQRWLRQWAVPRAEVERYEARHGSRKARPGYDLTLRPPKSVSILWALGTADQRAAIRQAHREAVDEVVAFIEGHALYARVSRPGQGRGRTETDGLVAAAFDHRTSRAGDPLLHTHVVTANLTRTPTGEWRAIDARGLYDNAHAGGFLYQAHLRHLLCERLGLVFGPVRSGLADVVGVPRRVIDVFSKRRDEIEEMLAEAGQTSAKARQVATLASRQAKDYGVDPATTETLWREQAAQLGFDDSAVAACFHRSTPTQGRDEKSLLDELAGPTGLTEKQSIFNHADVTEAIASRLGAAPARVIEGLVDRFLASPRVVPLAVDAANGGELVWRRDGTRTRSADLARFTTPELLACEAELLDWGANGFGTAVPGAPTDVVDDVLTQWATLSAEQVTAVRTLCAPDGPGVLPLAGRPGAGKTFALAAAVEAAATAGLPVIGCSVAATAAAELEAATHLQTLTGRPATTLARLFIDLERQPLPARSVVVVDESSMLATRDLHRLTTAVAEAGGRLWLVGDTDQHGAVDAGGMFRRLVLDHPDRVTHLRENRRQVDPDDRAAITSYRNEMVDAALNRYDTAGRVHRSPTAADSYRALVNEWFNGALNGSRDPMIAGQHRVRRALNRHAREQMIQAGMVTGDPIVTRSGHEFAVGDWVVARRNAYGLRSEQGFVKNGSTGTITELTPRSVRVTFDRDGTIELPLGYVDAWLDHGYAQTTYGVQGRTLDRALYHAGDASSFEEGYVALTRGRHETHIFLVDGQATVDADTGHDGHDSPTTGLATVTDALERRRSNTLAHDADPDAAARVQRYGRWTAAQLRTERDRLRDKLGEPPARVNREHDAVTERRDRLVARTRLTALNPAHEGIAFEAAIRAADAHLEVLEPQLAKRIAWEDTNADTLVRARLARVAEDAARLQDRIAAPTSAGPSKAIDQAVRRALASATIDTDPLDPTRLSRRVDAALRSLDQPTLVSPERSRDSLEVDLG